MAEPPPGAQLAIFIASRATLAMYREFVFPEVPTRTGLLPAGIDDLRVARPEIVPLATDIAISKAAIVIYDRAGRVRIPLDYVQALRVQRAIVVVESIQPSDTHPSHPVEQGSSARLTRAPDMQSWMSDFVDSVLQHISKTLPQQNRVETNAALNRHATDGRHSDSLLTALALLENQMRIRTATSSVPINPTGSALDRLNSHFGKDADAVLRSVELRHRLLEEPAAEMPELESTATELVGIARRRLDVPDTAASSPVPKPPTATRKPRRASGRPVEP